MGLLTFLVGGVLLAGSAIVLLFTFFYFRNKMYFKKRGIPFAGGGYSRMWTVLSGKMALNESDMYLYRDCKATGAPFAGYIDGFINSAVFITDMDLVRHISVKDFEHFVNRRKFNSMPGDILFKKMFLFMENEEWRGMRTKLSPTFTTGKIRRMFSIFEQSSERMGDYLNNIVGSSGKDMDLAELFSKYTMDVIASSAFGINSKSFETPPGSLSEFEQMGNRFQFKIAFLMFVKFLFVQLAPGVANALGIEALDLVPQRYFIKVVNDVLKHRKETGERHNDFLQLMIDTQQGLLKDEESAKETLEVMTGSEGGDVKSNAAGIAAHTNKVVMDDENIVANCVLFLIAGFDTTQSLLQFSAYTLGLNPDVQERLLKEVRKTMEANDGKLSYEAIHEMQYLDMFVNETLRLFPPAGRTERMCNKDYPVPGTDKVIEKGVLVSLPIMGVHRDPDYYENPEKFDPERFSPDRKSTRHHYSFAGFGHGPRNCIGMRFALTEAKAVIAKLVLNFKLEPCSKTDIPLKFGASNTLKAKNGIWLSVRRRTDN